MSDEVGTQPVERVNPFDNKRSFDAPPDGTPEAMVPAIPDEVVALTMMTLQSSQLRHLLNELTPRKKRFLKMRAVYDTDARARHMMGHMRRKEDVNYDRVCACGIHLDHWVDMREATLLTWKQDPYFMAAYNALVVEPLLFSQAWMETLGTKALAAYEDLLEPGVKPEVRRAAAKDMVEALDLKPTVGVQGSGRGEKVQRSFQLNMAIERASRGLEVSDAQRRLIEAAGMRVEELQPKKLAISERTLDGEDIEGTFHEIVDPDEDRGGDNSQYLPD